MKQKIEQESKMKVKSKYEWKLILKYKMKSNIKNWKLNEIKSKLKIHF